MCSPGDTFQPIYLPSSSADDDEHMLRIRGGARQLQVCAHNFAGFPGCLFTIVSPKTMVTILRHEGAGARLCLCPPGSVTGICPCRAKECRAWLVTGPRGQTSLPKTMTSSFQIQLSAWGLHWHVTECVVCPNNWSEELLLLSKVSRDESTWQFTARFKKCWCFRSYWRCLFASDPSWYKSCLNEGIKV